MSNACSSLLPSNAVLGYIYKGRINVVNGQLTIKVTDLDKCDGMKPREKPYLGAVVHVENNTCSPITNTISVKVNTNNIVITFTEGFSYDKTGCFGIYYLKCDCDDFKTCVIPAEYERIFIVDGGNFSNVGNYEVKYNSLNLTMCGNTFDKEGEYTGKVVKLINGECTTLSDVFITIKSDRYSFSFVDENSDRQGCLAFYLSPLDCDCDDFDSSVDPRLFVASGFFTESNYEIPLSRVIQCDSVLPTGTVIGKVYNKSGEDLGDVDITFDSNGIISLKFDNVNANRKGCLAFYFISLV